MMKDIRLEMACPFCGVVHYVECREDQYNAYCNGELAQVAFDDLTATEREQIISHICPDCQAEVFCEPDEPDDLEMGFDPYMGDYSYDCQEQLKKSVDKLLQMCYYNNVRSGDAISEPQQSRNATYLTHHEVTMMGRRKLSK